MSRKPLILIVDDEENIRNILEKLIQAMGYDTALASSSQQALLLLEQHQPDLTLLDIKMPGVLISGSNSMDVITTIRDKTTTHTRIIMISDTDNMDEIATCIKAGADDFLLKPFNATLFKARINHALNAINHKQEIKKIQKQHADCQLKLQQAEMSRAEFCQTLVHDLNNKLTGILMNGELMLMRNPPEAVSTGIQQIIESADEITTLIKQRKEELLS